ncbi:hypothetical protein QF001_003305 [Paraburkholderia youngii]
MDPIRLRGIVDLFRHWALTEQPERYVAMCLPMTLVASLWDASSRILQRARSEAIH